MRKTEHVFQTGTEAYDRLTEYLAADQKESLTQQLDTLNEQETTLAKIASDINKGHWNTLFTSDQCSQFPAQALWCLRDGKITTMQYVTSQMFYNVCTAPENQHQAVKVERVITEGKLIRSSMQKIEATMKLASSSLKAYMTGLVRKAKAKEEQSRFIRSIIKAPPTEKDFQNRLLADVDLKHFDEAEKAGYLDWLSDTEKNAFYRRLTELPASEQNFIIMDDPLYYDDDKTSVIQQINYRLGFNIFSRLRVDGKPKLMIPSAGMMQAYLEVTRPNTRMPAVYRFGLSPLEGLYNTMKSGCRDKIICTPLLPKLTPTHADSYPANSAWAEAELHDFYHEVLCANVPFGDRNLLVEFIDKLKSLGNLLPGTHMYVDRIRESLIDLEFRAYDRHIDKSQFLSTLKQSQKSTDPHARFWSVIETFDKLCSLLIFAKEKNLEDQRRFKEIDETVAEGRRKIAPVLASWLLEKDQAFNAQFKLDFTQLMTFPSDPNSLIALVQQELKKSLQSQLKNQGLRELMDMLFPTKDSRLKTIGFFLYLDWARSIMPIPEKPGPLLTDAIKHTIIEMIEKDFESAVLITYELKSPFLLNLVHEELGKKLWTFIESGVLAKLEQEYPRQYDYLFSHFRATPEADRHIKQALGERESEIHPCNRKILERLYPKGDLNRVYPSDQTTLLQRALKAEYIELMLRLTNEGASVVDVPGAAKPCPLAECTQYGRNDVILLLIYAYKYGAGWMEKFPDVVGRIRRMSTPFRFRDFCDYPESEEDNQWALDLMEKTPLPRHIFDSIDREKLARETQSTIDNSNRFFEKLKTDGHITLDMNDPLVEAFARTKKWADSGGPMPVTPTLATEKVRDDSYRK